MAGVLCRSRPGQDAWIDPQGDDGHPPLVNIPHSKYGASPTHLSPTFDTEVKNHLDLPDQNSRTRLPVRIDVRPITTHTFWELYNEPVNPAQKLVTERVTGVTGAIGVI